MLRQYPIPDRTMPVLEIQAAAEEKIIALSGELSWMTEHDRTHDHDRHRERWNCAGFQQSLGTATFGGDGFVLQKLDGQCQAFVELGGEIVNKMKQFRRIETRYDKLQRTFFAPLRLVATFILVRNWWRAPGARV